MHYLNEKLGVEIQNPSHSIWEARLITNNTLSFNERAAKDNNPMALMVKTSSRFEFVKKIYASSGFHVSESVIPFDLFMKAVSFRECDVYENASESLKDKIDALMVKMGRAVTKIEKCRATVEAVSIGWDDDEEEPETIKAVREELEKTEGFLARNLEQFGSRVKKNDKNTEWLPMQEIRELPEWDDNVESFFISIFKGIEYKPLTVEAVKEEMKEIELPPETEEIEVFEAGDSDCFEEETEVSEEDVEDA